MGIVPANTNLKNFPVLWFASKISSKDGSKNVSFHCGDDFLECHPRPQNDPFIWQFNEYLVQKQQPPVTRVSDSNLWTTLKLMTRDSYLSNFFSCQDCKSCQNLTITLYRTMGSQFLSINQNRLTPKISPTKSARPSPIAIRDDPTVRRCVIRGIRSCKALLRVLTKAV